MGGSWLGRACRRLIDHEGRPKDRTSRQIHRFIHKKRSIRKSIAALETTASKRPFAQMPVERPLSPAKLPPRRFALLYKIVSFDMTHIETLPDSPHSE